MASGASQPPYEVEEWDGSPHYEGSGLQLSAVRTVTIAWTNIDSHYTSLFPAAVLGIPSFPALMPGSSVLFAENATYDPICGEEDVIISAPPGPVGSPVTSATFPNCYALAKCVITYKTYPWAMSPSGNNIISRKISTKSEILTLPIYGLSWASDNAALEDSTLRAGKTYSVVQFHITLHRVPNFNYASLSPLCGMVNNATFEGIPAGCLMFMGVDADQTVTADNTNPWEVTLLFATKIVDGNTSQGWNTFFRSNKGKYDQLQITNGGGLLPPSPLFASTNFSVLY